MMVYKAQNQNFPRGGNVPPLVFRAMTEQRNYHMYVGFVIFTAAVMKDAIFCDVAAFSSYVNRRFGGMPDLHLV
jgi:hypothetical protein